MSLRFRDTQMRAIHIVGESIVKEVAVKYDLTPEDLRSRSRTSHLIEPRFESYARLYDETSMSLPEIARFMNRDDHTSIRHGIREFRKWWGK
jgi:chromosomal replication initiation ATPase DnaA